jgi:predicted GTPase
MKTKVLILGAAGRDFHNFNVLYRDNPEYEIVGFTATQIPDIAGRKYPKELAGSLYSNGISIYDEKDMEKLIKEHKVDEVVLSYSDLKHETVMHLASRANAVGADFRLIGAQRTMIKSKKKVIAVCATRTGCGKSPTSRKIVSLLRDAGKKVVVIRHPMPYGDLKAQTCQRYATLDDMDKNKCTIEEMEEYEHHIRKGCIVYAGVDYQKILNEAEKEADVILWDGGNNDTSFYKPDLLFVIADSLRPNHEKLYYPGETNFRMADVIVINKIAQNPEGAKIVEENARTMNPKAKIIKAFSELSVENEIDLNGKKVLVVEDGPTVTHGEMGIGAAYVYAQQKGAIIIDPKPFATGDIKEAYVKYPQLKLVVPALGYGKKQIKDLEDTLNRAQVDYVITGTPIDISRFMKINKKVLHVIYNTVEKEGSIKDNLKPFL